MGNIIDYVLECGKQTMLEQAFSDEDSLVLAQFSYLKLDGVVPGIMQELPSVSLQEIQKRAAFEKMFADERYAEVNSRLFEAMCASRRFSNIRFHFHENKIDLNMESQFSAITCFLEDGSAYAAYRGTDETIVGWKEDFNMAFRAPVWGQKLSVEYLNCVAEKYRGKLRVGGHSKGGNFAVYAAMNCKEEAKRRLESVYSHDGPGFRPELLAGKNYEGLKEKLHKIIPRSSVVGMILENHEAYTVVESSSFGMLQHDPYTWVVKNGKFVKADDIYQGRQLMNEVLNQWILSLEEEQLSTFIEALFQVIEASQASTLLDFTADWKKSLGGMITAAGSLEPETKKQILKVLREFLKAASKVAKEHLSEK